MTGIDAIGVLIVLLELVLFFVAVRLWHALFRWAGSHSQKDEADRAA
jgi:uncharacterized membrane protein